MSKTEHHAAPHAPDPKTSARIEATPTPAPGSSLSDIGNALTTLMEVEAAYEQLKGAPIGEAQHLPVIKTELGKRHAQINISVTFLS